MDYKIGDVVRMKSGGPMMTVNIVGGTKSGPPMIGSDIPAGCVHARWFDIDDRLGEAVFDVETIVAVPDFKPDDSF